MLNVHPCAVESARASKLKERGFAAVPIWLCFFRLGLLTYRPHACCGRGATVFFSAAPRLGSPFSFSSFCIFFVLLVPSIFISCQFFFLFSPPPSRREWDLRSLPYPFYLGGFCCSLFIPPRRSSGPGPPSSPPPPPLLLTNVRANRFLSRE